MSEPTLIDPPVGLRWVKLVCRLGRLVADSEADADAHPDILPVGGKLTLSASPSRVRFQEADGRWRSIELAGRTYTIRADGELIDNQGRVGVYIPDPASLLVEPQGYLITAEVKPTAGTEWSVTVGGVTVGGDIVLPDVVDLVAVSSVGYADPSVTASFDARIHTLETGVGFDVSQAVADYLTANPPAPTPDATTTTKGILQLAGDLGGTATAPTVPGLEDKADEDHSHTLADITDYSPPDLSGYAPATQPINARTAAYTLVASDAGKLVTVTRATAVNVTVPAGVFTAGQRVDVLDLGAGRVTFVAGSGMTLGGTPSLVSRDQYSAHSVVFLSATQAVVVGDLEVA